MRDDDKMYACTAYVALGKHLYNRASENHGLRIKQRDIPLTPERSASCEPVAIAPQNPGSGFCLADDRQVAQSEITRVLFFEVYEDSRCDQLRIHTFRLSLSNIAVNQAGSLLGSTSSTTAPFVFPARRLTLGDCVQLASSLSSSLTSGLSIGPKFGLFITTLEDVGLSDPGLALLSVPSVFDDIARDSGAASKCLGTPIALATAAASWSVAEGNGPMMLFRLTLSKE
jgi:hypothetical protein